MAYYLVGVGEGSKYVNEARKNNFIAIGWEDLKIDLDTIRNIDDLKQNLSKSYPNYTNSQLGVQSGQIFRFKELKSDDVVLSPIGNGQYSVGKVIGSYTYKSNPTDSCPYLHRHKVKWLDTILKKQDMSSNLTYSLGATLTIFSLDKYANEIQSLIEGRLATPAEQPERIRDVIINGLFELDGKEFEKFISHLLSIIGFKATTTQYVGDKGIDVNGILNVDGIAEIILRVQVKRVKGSIGNKDILAMRGTLAQGEHACFITLSSFSKQAQEEAEAAGKVSVKLIDGEDLASLVLKHFDDIDQKYRNLFLIKKKKDFNLEDLFEFKDAEVEKEEELTEEKVQNDKFDTLLCSAKEDGFKMAFIDQKSWWAVRIKKDNIPSIKYLAMYQVAPISAITYYGEIDKIELFEGGDKYKIFLKEIKKLDNPISIGNNPHLKPQGPKYTKLKKILKSKTLDDVFRK